MKRMKWAQPLLRHVCSPEFVYRLAESGVAHSRFPETNSSFLRINQISTGTVFALRNSQQPFQQNIFLVFQNEIAFLQNSHAFSKVGHIFQETYTNVPCIMRCSSCQSCRTKLAKASQDSADWARS